LDLFFFWFLAFPPEDREIPAQGERWRLAMRHCSPIATASYVSRRKLMRTQSTLMTLTATAGLLVGALASSLAAPASLLVSDSAWSLSGAASTTGGYTSFLTLPTINPHE
jgi:hypothetical protein